MESIIDPNTLTCEVFTSFDEISHMQDEWDKFLLDVHGDIYLSYDWCRVWWEYYGKGRELAIFIYRNNGTIVGIFPIFIERLLLLPVRLKVAKIVGSDFTLVMLNPAVQSKHAKNIFTLLIMELLNTRMCDAVLFGPVSGIAESVSELRSAFSRDSNSAIRMKEKNRMPYTVFNLPESFEKFLSSLEKRQRANYRRTSKLLQETFKIQIDMFEDTDRFEEFQKLHESQWQAQGKLGHFKDWPSGYEFNKSLADTGSQKGRFRLLRLKADDQVVFYELFFTFGDTLYWRLGARTLGSEWDRFSLGRLGLIKMIEWAISHGYKNVEGGQGHYEYKVKSGGIEHDLNTVLIYKNKWHALFRVWIFSLFSEILNLVYYKIWFSRLAPKMPFARKPLLKLWIRSHI